MPGEKQGAAEFFEAKIGKQTIILRENAEQFAKIQAAMTATYLKELEARKKGEKDLLDQIAKWEADHRKERRDLERAVLEASTTEEEKKAKAALAAHIDALEAQKDALIAYQQETQQITQTYEDQKAVISTKAAQLAQTFELNAYRRMTASKRREYAASVAAALKEDEEGRKARLAILAEEADAEEKRHKKELKDIREALKAELEKQQQILDSTTATAEEKAKALEAIAAAEEEAKTKRSKETATHKEAVKTNTDEQAAIEEKNKQQQQAEEASKKFSKEELRFNPDAKKAARHQKTQDAADRVGAAEEKTAAARAAVDEKKASFAKEEEAIQKKIQAAKERGDKRELKNLQSLLKRKQEAHEEELANSEEMKALNEAEAEEEEARREAQKQGISNMLAGALSNGLSASVDRISGNLEQMYGEQGRMMGRLQGSTTNWAASLLKVTATVGVSGLVSQKEVVKRMTELVDSGVAYNLELRAFLAETSENIASTFDAANGTLLRLIRVQQQDTTAARLGMEASLTKLFNQYFQDTSYLTDSGAHDSVTDAIFEAMAGMSRDQAIEFEFTTQKWLGSLASVGMSNEAVTQIAQGLNYLGTGNVTQLNNSPALQTLFAMSAARAGKSYSDILSGGLTADTTNDLLKAMIEYLAEIAASQDNQVTKSAYAELFGMSIADFNTFTSLTNSEITNLANMSTSYDKLVTETSSQLNKLITRISVSTMVDTAMDNAEVGAATLIGSNPITYGMWKAMSLLKTYVGEVEIPGITGMGNGLASGMDLLNLAQTGMAGIGLLGSLVAGLPSMLLGGPTNLALWNAFTGARDSTSRGSNLSVLSEGTEDSTSQKTSVGVGNTSGDDISSTTEQSGMDKGYETAGTSEEELDEEKEIYKKIYAAIAEDESLTVISVLQDMADLLALDRIFMTNPLELSKDTSHLVNLYNANGFDYGKSLTTIANDYKQELLEAEKDPLLKAAISGKTTETLIKELQEKNGNSSFVETDFYKTTYTGDALTSYLESYQDNSLSELLIKEQMDNENDSLIILQDIRTLLDKNRVFYTAITGAFDSTTAGNILSLSSQLSTYSSAVTSNTTENTTQQTLTSATATSAISNMPPNSNSDVTAAAGHQDIGTIIAEAITKALSSINAIPVNVQNSATTIP